MRLMTVEIDRGITAFAHFSLSAASSRCLTWRSIAILLAIVPPQVELLFQTV